MNIGQKYLRFLFIFLLIHFTYPAFAIDIDSSGEISVQLRQFENNGDLAKVNSGTGVYSRLKLESELPIGNLKFEGSAFVDTQDSDRDLIVLEDLYLKSTLLKNRFTVKGGWQVFNWSNLEVFHPADIINSRNHDSDLENLQKMGELTLSLELPLYNGEASFFLWPRVESPKFPGNKSRLGLGIDLANPMWVSENNASDGGWQTQFGFLLNQSIGEGDYSFYYVNHIDRSSPIVGNESYTDLFGTFVPENNIVNIPYYFDVSKIGLSVQQVIGEFVLKLEAIDYNYSSSKKILTALNETTTELKTALDHQKVAVGLEHNYYHTIGVESTFLIEYIAILGLDKLEKESLSPFQNDLFLGHRLNLNNTSDSEFFYGIIVDLERSHELFYNFRYSQRIWKSFKVKTGFRVYDAPFKEGEIPKGLQYFDGANQLYLNLTKYF